MQWEGDFSQQGQASLTSLLEGFMQWSLTLNQQWGGLLFTTPTHNETVGGNVSWQVGVCRGPAKKK